MKLSAISLVVVILGLFSCSPSPTQEVINITTTSTSRSTEAVSVSSTTTTIATVTATPSPTSTLLPDGDPDQDGVPTYYEIQRGTNPLVHESWEGKSILPGSILVKMVVSYPYDVEDLSLPNIYQDVRIVQEESGRLFFEAIIYPNARHEIYPTPLDKLGYPEEYLAYLESTASSDFTVEMVDLLNTVISGAVTDVDAIDRIWKWNHVTFEINDSWREISYYHIRRIQASDMFEIKKTRMSTTVATLLAAELRSIGIPTRIVQQVFAIPCFDCSPNSVTSHPQNQVLLNTPIGFQWVTLDYNEFPRGGIDPTRIKGETPYYGLVMTDAFRDFMEADFGPWEYVTAVLEGVIDAPDGYSSWNDLSSSLIRSLYQTLESTEN